MSKAKERFLHWLQCPSLDIDLRKELEAIQDQPDEIEERFYTYLSFGTGGLRGEIGAGTNRMNIYTIRKSTLGLANHLHQQIKGNKKSVVIAYDCRHKSAEFAEETALTLAEQGIKAYVYPSLRSTPQLSYSVRRLAASAGVMITASHNPPEYNGYKVYGADGAQLNLDHAKQVITHVNQVNDELAIKVMSKEEALQAGWMVMLGGELDRSYTDYVHSLSLQPDIIRQMANKFKIVFTALHGTSLDPVQKVLHQAGFKQVTYVQEQMRPDPNFSTVASPNPEEHEAFTLAIQYAQKLGADIIMGTDPDADRMGLVAQNGQGQYEVLTGNQTGALLLYYILTQKQAKGEISPNHVLCKTIVTSDIGRAIAASFGLETIDTLTGFKFIGEKMKEFHEQGKKKFLFGYEESYGYLFGDEVRDKDAIQAVFLAAEMGAYYKSKGMTLYEALEQMYQKYGYYQEDLISITLKGLEGVAKIKEIMEQLRNQPPRSVASQMVTVVEDYMLQTRQYIKNNKQEQIHLPSSNVLKYYLENETWFCVRPSGTEPKLKMYIGTKAETRKLAKEKSNRVKEHLKQLINT